jgi:NAD(P)-dependent dehydrogenase (short-subunit alcohol dehydrogenase family)
MSSVTNEKRYYLVSGATGTIGKQVVKLLLEKGYGVAAITRNSKLGKKSFFKDDIFWSNFDYENNEIPLGNRNPFHEILKKQKFFGSFHCAGAYHSGDPGKLNIEDYSFAMKANLFSAINIVKYSLSMVEPSNSIVVLNSQASVAPAQSEVAYGVSKRALSAYIDGMQMEATRKKLQLVNVLCGAVQSPMVNSRNEYENFIEVSELADLLIKVSGIGSSLRIKNIEVLRRNY